MQNEYVERFNRSYREGVLDAYILTTIHQAREETAIWMEDYNTTIRMTALMIKNRLIAYENSF